VEWGKLAGTGGKMEGREGRAKFVGECGFIIKDAEFFSGY